jgi:hypothetical protein
VGFHESVEFVVDEPGDGPDDGKDGVDGVADGIVQGCFSAFAGEEVVSVMVAGLVAGSGSGSRWRRWGRQGAGVCFGRGRLAMLRTLERSVPTCTMKLLSQKRKQ